MATAAATPQSFAQPSDQAGHPRRWWILGVVSFAAFTLFADNTIVNTALPSIARDLDASTSHLQWIVDSYVLMLAGLLLVGGTIGDLFGRRRWFDAGLAIFGLGAAVAALSNSSEQLILGRAIQGVGGALIMPATLSIITNVFPPRERAKAIGIWTGVTGLAMGFGPALGGYVVDATDWQTVFWLHIPAVTLTLAGSLVIPESRDPRTRGLDLPGAISGTAALTALVFGIIKAGEAGWTAPVVGGAFLLAGIAGLAFVLIETRTANPMLPLHFFKQRQFAASVVIIGLVFFSVSVTFFFLTQFYQFVQGRTAFEAGLLGIPSAIAMGVGAPLSGLLVKRVGPKVLVVAAMMSCAFGLSLLSLVDADTSTLQIVATMCFFGLAGGIGLVPLTDLVMSSVPGDEAGVASAVNDVSRELGAALGIAVIGSIVSGAYRANVEQSLAGNVPADVIHSAGEGLGVATTLAGSLPPEVAGRVLEAANAGFVDAIGIGFLLSAALLVIPMAAAARFLPGRARTAIAPEPLAEPEPTRSPEDIALAA
ncbi:MAG: DHA2 family efflux MFS transporter permease subunit [Hyphomicrobiales bacterium]